MMKVKLQALSPNFKDMDLEFKNFEIDPNKDYVFVMYVDTSKMDRETADQNIKFAAMNIYNVFPKNCQIMISEKQGTNYRAEVFKILEVDKNDQ